MNRKNTNRLALAAFTAALLLACCASTVADGGDTAPTTRLAISVKPKVTAGEPMLHVTVSNLSGAPVTLHATSLPWLSLTAMQISAVEDSLEGAPLVRAVPGWEAGPDTFVLPARGSINGDVRLTDYFPSLNERLQKTGVVVYWNMRVLPLDAPESERFFGGVVFDATPRQR